MMTKPWLLRAVPDPKRLSTTTILVLCLGGCNAPAPTPALESALTQHDCDNPNPALFELDARPHGRSMESWSEDWWRWAYSMPASSNPNATLTVDCNENQRGPMFFLPSFFPGLATVTRSCTVPRHKTIAVLLVSLLNDFPCPDPTFKPAPGQTLFDFLSIGAAQGQAQDVAEVDASLDGNALKDVMSYHVSSDDLFSLTGDVSLQSFDSCITGSRQPAVAASYFIVLKELEPGPHVFASRWVSPSGAVQAQTVNLNVRGSD
jgi:hypothetical protein